MKGSSVTVRAPHFRSDRMDGQNISDCRNITGQCFEFVDARLSYCFEARRYWSISDREMARSAGSRPRTQATCSIVAALASVSSSHVGPQWWTRTEASSLPPFPMHSSLPSSRLRIASAVRSSATAMASYSSAGLPSPIVNLGRLSREQSGS